MELREDTSGERHIGGRSLTRWTTVLGRAMVRLAHWLVDRISARGVLYLTALIGVVLVTVLTAVGGEVYEAVAEHDGIAALDQPALNTALEWRSPALDEGMTWFTHLGGPARDDHHRVGDHAPPWCGAGAPVRRWS